MFWIRFKDVIGHQHVPTRWNCAFVGLLASGRGVGVGELCLGLWWRRMAEVLGEVEFFGFLGSGTCAVGDERRWKEKKRKYININIMFFSG